MSDHPSAAMLSSPAALGNPARGPAVADRASASSETPFSAAHTSTTASAVRWTGSTSVTERVVSSATAQSEAPFCQWCTPMNRYVKLVSRSAGIAAARRTCCLQSLA